MSDASPSAREETEVSRQITLVREQWAGVIQAVVAVCNGNTDAADRLAPFLDQMEQKDDWRGLVAVLRRILEGERRASALLEGLDDTDTLIAGDILRELGVNVPPFWEEQGQAEGDEHGDMVSLEEFIHLVARACKPDAPAGLAEQLHGATLAMASQADLSPEVRELGRVLNQILSGDRSPDLSALPPELSNAVQLLLNEIAR